MPSDVVDVDSLDRVSLGCLVAVALSDYHLLNLLDCSHVPLVHPEVWFHHSFPIMSLRIVIGRSNSHDFTVGLLDK